MRSLMRLVLVTGVVGSCCWWPASSLASRPATSGERARIDRELPSGMRGASCTRLTVSTVDTTFAKTVPTNRGECAKGDGFTIFERDGADGDWAEVGNGPNDPRQPGCFKDFAELAPVPVLRDLKICGVEESRTSRATRCRSVVNPYRGTKFEGVDLSRITASKVSCSRARQVAKGAHAKGLRVETESYTWDGWHIESDLATASDRYRATKGRATVTWRF